MADLDQRHEKVQAFQKMTDAMKVLIRRDSEALKVYRPLSTAAGFHSSSCRVRLARGSNRSGKTLIAAVEVARAATRADPFRKYPQKGDIYIVTEEWGDVGRVIYPKLFLPGPFKVIRDRETGLMRAFRPWEEFDRMRSDETKEADPLIPQRFIDKISWYSEADNQPLKITLKTGWVLWFFSAKSKPPSGSAIDLAWLDEEIPKAEWFVELNSRVAEREGKIMWTATPEIGTDQFYDYATKAEEQAMLPQSDRDVEHYLMTLADNPHITSEAKRGMASMLSDEDYQIRILGEFASSGRFIFPEYQRPVHLIEHPDPPKHWSHYAVVDPGHQICAVLFASVPDPTDAAELEEPFDLLVWKELYIPKCSAIVFAEQMKLAIGDYWMEDFVIDMHGARVTEMGSGLTVYEQYRDALAKLEVTCRRRGSSFGAGNDDVAGGIERVRGYLMKSHYTGFPRIRMVGRKSESGMWTPILTNLDYEMRHWKNKTVSGLATDQPETRGRTHLVACMRYLCSHRPTYVPPEYGEAHPSNPLAWIQRMERKAARQMETPPSGFINLGPAGSYQ